MRVKAYIADPVRGHVAFAPMAFLAVRSRIDRQWQRAISARCMKLFHR